MAFATDTSKLAIIELTIFCPVAVVVPCIMRGHGFHTTGSLSWLFLSILSVLRIIGASTQLSIRNSKESSTSNELLDAVSFAPLLLVFINVSQQL